MSENTEQKHISFELNKGEFLPPLQKRIVLHLAKNRPQTINETVKSLRGSYKSTWLAFNTLEEKQVIKKMGVKYYRGQDFPCFWLTSAGVLISLFAGISFEVLLEKTLKMYPDDKNLPIILELSPIFGIEPFKIAFSTLLKKGKLEEKDFMMIVTAEMQSDFDGKQPEDIIAVLKKHPVAYENTKQYARKALEKISKLDSLFK
jgi:hypothetical protein